MKSLKSNIYKIFTLLIILIGCQSSNSFKLKSYEKEELFEVEVGRNRITQECYFINAEKENNWRHQYILYILNNENEVIPVYYPINQGKIECLIVLKNVEKILSRPSSMRLCVRGVLDKRTEKGIELKPHDFGVLGKHKSAYHALTFDTICNSSECYGISHTWISTCSGFKK